MIINTRYYVNLNLDVQVNSIHQQYWLQILSVKLDNLWDQDEISQFQIYNNLDQQ